MFTTEPLDGPPGQKVELTPKTMRYSDSGHEVSMQWKPDLGGTEDHYDLVIAADGVTSRRRVAYGGKPIVLVEQPYRVVMENVHFGNPKAEQ